MAALLGDSASVLPDLPPHSALLIDVPEGLTSDGSSVIDLLGVCAASEGQLGKFVLNH